MKNLNKTTKTILFASLIAAMILPLSAMDFADAQTDKTVKDVTEKKLKKYQVEITESILKESYYDEENNKVQKFDVTIKALELPTYQELLDANQAYYDFLITELGDDGKKRVEELKSELKSTFDNRKDTFKTTMTRIGEQSIQFGDFSFDQPNGNKLDFVNTVFFDKGSSYDANRVIDNYAQHGWATSSTLSQYVLIHDSGHGTGSFWAQSVYSQSEGPFFGQREHVRIYDGGYDTHGQYDEWSVGTAHQETWNWGCFCHEIDSWENAESELRNDLVGQTDVGSVGTFNQGNSGWWQGSYNNGIARLIQLT